MNHAAKTCVSKNMMWAIILTHVKCIGEGVVALVINVLVLEDEEDEADGAQNHKLLECLPLRGGTKPKVVIR